MNSFRNHRLRDLTVPMSTAWLLNDIAEAKGRQELYIRQSPQVLKALREMALIQSAESSNRIEGVTVAADRLRPLVLGNTKPRDRSEQEVQGYRLALNEIHTRYELTPWFNFLLAVVRRGYAEFEKRAGQVKAPRGTKAELVLAAVREQPGDFRLSDIERDCPSVGREWIRSLLRDLKAAGEASCRGKGPAARWHYLGSEGMNA
jgi:hypothetical protein